MKLVQECGLGFSALYILNDLPNCLSDCEPRMYADDMQTYSKCDQTRIYAERIWPKAKYPRCFPISDNELVLGLNRLQLQNHWDY